MAYTAIDDPSAYFKVQLYSGDGTAIGSGGQVITFDDTDTDMQPDLVWVKCRSINNNHNMVDSVRGGGKKLAPNSSYFEETKTEGIASFQSDGFTVGDYENVNKSGETFVAWCWKESATAGFDIVSYTGNGTDDTDISHNLSAVPKMIIVKNRDATDSWQVYHSANTAAPETDYQVLDEYGATTDNVDRWSDEAPTSSVFTLGDGDEVNTDTEDYIAYCFAEKQGYSKFGSYTGNADADGPFVYTGFRPAFVLFKGNNTSDWQLWDNKRDPFNPVEKASHPDNVYVASTDQDIDFLSNGFKIRGSVAHINGDGVNFIYMAFAEAPLVNSNGVPCNAR